MQRLLDEGGISENDLKTLETVVPVTDSWKFTACRIVNDLNYTPDSPWQNRIQMPNDKVSKCITLQAFFTSLEPMLKAKRGKSDILLTLEAASEKGVTGGLDSSQIIVKVLKNFWSAVAEVNPKANQEPQTNVLWAPIGVNACHIALASVMETILNGDQPSFEKEIFVNMLAGSLVQEYEHWYTKRGAKSEAEYPAEKGEATRMTGAANYKREASDLEKEWRATLHSATGKNIIRL